MKYRDKIIAYLDTIEPGTVLNLNGLYEKQFYKMSQAAFFKAMERLVTDGILLRAAKGMYVKAGSPKEAQEAVLNYYFGENNDNGMYIGYHLYHKYGITEEKSDVVELYSNKMTKQTANIGNIHVKRTTIVLNYENTRVVEALEILEHFDEIEGLNKHKFARYARQFATGYQDATVTFTIKKKAPSSISAAIAEQDDDSYKITLSSSYSGLDANWWKALSEIKVNDGDAASVKKVEDETAFILSSLTPGTQYELTLIADGYNDATVTVKTPNKAGAAPLPTKIETNWTGGIDITFGMGNDAYMNAITGVSVNGTNYPSGNAYDISAFCVSNATDGILKLGANLVTSNTNVVVITATKYPDLTITIKDGKLVSAVASAE